MRRRILVTSRIHAATRERLAALGELDANEAAEPLGFADTKTRVAAANAMLAFMPDRVDAEFAEAAPHLQIVACALKGFDNFDVAACARNGVWVSIVPDLLTEPTAELAVGLSIALARNVTPGDAAVREGFQGWRASLYGTGLDGSTVSIVGMGAVGHAIARRLAGFGCRLLGVDPHPQMPGAIESVSFAQALVQSDFMILAAPLNTATRHLIDRAALARLKAGAMLVNIGRGSVVNEAAVAEALEAGTLGGYAADVFELEDWALEDRPREIDARLLASPKTLFTPHLGSAVTRVRMAIEMRAAENIADVFAGRPPRDAINEPVFRRLAS
jgi:phosphonate dehydrogenase